MSEDGESPEVHNVVSNAFEEMKAKGVIVPLLHLHHPAANKPAENGYFRLSRHFKWALTQVTFVLRRPPSQFNLLDLLDSNPGWRSHCQESHHP